ncbi:agamous-like MADS-box protein AGL62 [Eutrema salsugineum]|nr:agamous-like MADS-box protein AGL62 [Eutrema salsugineum]
MIMRGTKRKIEIEKRETKQQRSVACSKRRKTLFSKAADLCRLSGANIAVFVTSPAESSDVVYSFSGYSSASEIADCYLNGKLPLKTTTKLGFWWQDPDLYRYCDDLSEINLIEERLERVKQDLMACLEKKQKTQSVTGFDQNPNTSSLDKTIHSVSSSSTSSSQNPSTCSSSRFVSDFVQSSHASSLSDISNSKFASFGDQDPNYSSSLDEINAGASSSQIDQNPSFWENLFNEHEFGLNNDLWKTKDDTNSSMSLTQETPTEPVVYDVGGYDDEKSFWENLFNDDVFGLNNDFCDILAPIA